MRWDGEGRWWMLCSVFHLPIHYPHLVQNGRFRLSCYTIIAVPWVLCLTVFVNFVISLIMNEPFSYPGAQYLDSEKWGTWLPNIVLVGRCVGGLTNRSRWSLGALFCYSFTLLFLLSLLWTAWISIWCASGLKRYNNSTAPKLYQPFSSHLNSPSCTKPGY